MERRRFLATVGTTSAAVLAGCSDSSDADNSGEDSNNDPSSNTPRSRTETLIEDTRVVNEDGWYKWGFRLNEEAQLNLRVTVRSGPPVDIVLTSASEFEEYEDENRFRYNQDLSMLDTPGGDSSAEAPTGDYALIADNTNRVEAQPPSNFDDDPAEVEVSLIAEF